MNPFHEAARRSLESHSRKNATAFLGASHSRLTEDWVFASIRSADAEIRGDIMALRKRAREMVRNSAHAARFLDLVSDNVIGATGIQLQARPRDELGEYDEEAAKKIEEAWERWSEPHRCSADGRSGWLDVQDLHVQTQAQDGESVLRLLPGFRNDFGFAVQHLDPDQLDEKLNRPAGDGKNEIRMGVEIDRWGRAVAYWLWDTHPFDLQGSAGRERIRVPAEQVVHRYQLKRPGQTRGYTWFAPILMDARMLAMLQEAELVASRMAAAKGGFFETEVEMDPESPAGSKMSYSWEMEPGVWDQLPPGMKPHFVDPTHPNAAFGEFNRIVLHTIAAGLKTSYASLTGDLTSVNFSSIRAGTLQERDIWKRLQEREAMHTHRRVFLAWLPWALAMGQIDLSVRERRRYERHRWNPRGWPWVDPLKDMAAAEKAIGLGLDSRTRLAAEAGRDFEEIMEEQKREQEVAKKKGVELAGGGGGGADAWLDDELWDTRASATPNGNGRPHAHR